MISLLYTRPYTLNSELLNFRCTGHEFCPLDQVCTVMGICESYGLPVSTSNPDTPTLDPNTTTSNPDSTLPAECEDYNILDEDSRNVNHGEDLFCDTLDYYGYDVYKSPSWVGPAWYRFMSPAGTMMPETSPGESHCGTVASGWLSGAHPAAPGESMEAKFCFDWIGDDCYEFTMGQVTHCGSYHVYYLVDTFCQNRYCAI